MALTQEEHDSYQKHFKLTDEEFISMDEVEFRARFRERVHHTLEIQVYAAAYRGKALSTVQADYAKRLVGIWEKRGLSKQLPDYTYAKKLIGFADSLSAPKPIDLTPYITKSLTREETAAFFTVVHERRSVREFKDKQVPDELINRILEAGLWAAHSCNLQSIRYLIVREETEPGLFKGSDIPGGPVHLVVLQDERVYRANSFMPVRNRLLDAGAAAQNIVLAAHAVGLESVWLTFNDEMVQRLRKRFNLPDMISIVTYVDVGYGDQTPCPPGRLAVKDAILGRL